MTRLQRHPAYGILQLQTSYARYLFVRILSEGLTTSIQKLFFSRSPNSLRLSSLLLAGADSEPTWTDSLTGVEAIYGANLHYQLDINPITKVVILKEKRKMSEVSKAHEEYDIFRDSPLRYLGYSNEVGEAFRYQVPKFVIPSYIVAFGYCTADAVTSGYDAYNKATDMGSSTATSDSLVSAVDTMLWQSLASVTIPGATINLIVKASRFAVARSPAALPGLVSTWLPTVTGLGSVPLIISPIDRAVDLFMDSTFRKIQWTQTAPETTEVKGEAE
eukprot:scaffold1390_cov138-Cylindrotheca_fusiformis.AAC.34